MPVEKPYAVTVERYGRVRFSVVEIVKETPKTHEILGGWRGERRPTRVMGPANYPARFDTRQQAEGARDRANSAWDAHADAVTAAEEAMRDAHSRRNAESLQAMIQGAADDR